MNRFWHTPFNFYNFPTIFFCLGSALQRNAATIARAQSLRDADQNKRREELQKRIEQTRLKLQNIGYQSMLKGSSSISDLTSHLPPTDRLNPNSRPESAMSDFHTHVNNNRSSSACKFIFYFLHISEYITISIYATYIL